MNKRVIIPNQIEALLFDLDGVVTRTADVHAAAWKRLFDEFLQQQGDGGDPRFRPFEETDYRDYVDGRPRYNGVSCFLASRNISIPYGDPADPPEKETVCGLGNRKNSLFLRQLELYGAEVFPSTVELIRIARARGLQTAIFSASRNCEAVLRAARIEGLFDARVDGLDADRQNLPGKPDPAVLLEAARRIGVAPHHAAVFEDATVGVQAGRGGGFGLVVGVNRTGVDGALLRHGAHAEVSDLADCSLEEGLWAPHGWALRYDAFDPAEEGVRETLCTLGNGSFATRGAAPEADADGTHYPGTYLAGGYNRLTTELDGHRVDNEDLVNFPNWLPLAFRIDDGDWFDVRNVEILEYRQELNLKQGILVRLIRFRDDEGRTTTISSRRFVHMRHRHLAGLETTITAEDWSGHVEVRSALDGSVVNAGVQRYQQLNNRHLEPLDNGIADDDSIWLKVRTSQSRIEVALAARTRVTVAGRQPASLVRTTVQQPEYVAQDLACDIVAGTTLTIEKIVSLVTSRDPAISECSLEARRALKRAGTFDELIACHTLTWAHLWRRCDIQVTDGDEHAPVLRLHVFHLLQTVSENTIDLDVGVPARGLHGEAYRGHIFWDEIFIFPFFNLRMPELTRALLLYRYRRLPEARAAAAEAGYQGAMYPWQGGSDGREESQRLHLNPRSGRWLPDNSYLQRHINSAIAFNVWQYVEVTKDAEFLSAYGAEMFLEIARFWASASTYNDQLQRYEIRGVMGPDEYHDAYPGAAEPGLKNNAYTNIMAVWVLSRAMEILEMLPPERQRELCEMLDLQREELERWDAVSRRMRLVFHGDGIISQFEGYDQLAEFDWQGYRQKYGNIQRLDRILEAEGDTPNNYKASKQADVLMLFYLFSADELRALFDHMEYPFEYETIPRNVAYYLERTSHGSTLSGVVHSWVLARSDRPRSWRFFLEALTSDLADSQRGTTQEGIHLGAMAGTIDLLQRGYTGMETGDDILWLNPSLPDTIRSLRVRLRYRHRWLTIEVLQDTVRVSTFMDAEEPAMLGVKDQVHRLAPGETRAFPL